MSINKNLYSKELKRNLKNLFNWSAIIISFTLLITFIFPYMSDMGDSMGQLMEKLPEELRRAMGVDQDTWSSILGFYNTYYGIYIIVLLSIYTSSTGSSILSKEEKNKTAEFLLTLPLSRKTIFTTKLLVLFTLSVFIVLLQALVAALLINTFRVTAVDWDVFLQMHISGFLLLLFFTSIGVLLSMLLNPNKNFMGIIVGITFGSYFLNAIGKSADPVAWISYISPFNYLEISNKPDIVFNTEAAIVLMLIAALMLYVSNRIYKRKDITG